MFTIERTTDGKWYVEGTTHAGDFTSRTYFQFERAQSFAVATFTSAKLDALTVSA